MKIKNYIVSALIFFSCLGHAQDFKSLIKEMHKDYEQCKRLHIAMEITVYDSAQTKPYYQQVADIKRDGANYWYQVEENEMLMNDKYLVMVDNTSRQIIFSRRSLEAEADLHKGLTFNLDSIFSLYDSFKHVGRENDAEHFVVTDKKGPIEETHFFIVPESRTLKQMAYRYRAGQYVSIRFMLFNKDVLFGADTFSESRYVTKVNNKLVPSPFFRQYELSYQ